MKTNIYILLMVTIFALGCSNNEEIAGDSIGVFPQAEKVIESYDPTSIKFVYEDGTEIQSDACLSPDVAYAVQIEAQKNNAGTTQVSKIEYTVNGATFSMSFAAAGTKRNPIVFVNGINSVELVKTAESKEVFFLEQKEFQLVE